MKMRTPKPQAMWGYYNFGILHGVAYTRRDAVKDVEQQVMEPWSKAREYMQVLKVTVTPTKQEPK